jgi:metal-responsive CopG/Arc/MetJ family transcriptional regulator
MRDTLTISLPAELRQQVARVCKRRQLTQSEFIRRALQEKLWEEAIEESRRRLVPLARAQGLYTDEDVFRVIS